MSILYDPRSKKPQLWTYPLFILLTIGIFVWVFFWGLKMADKKGVPADVSVMEEPMALESG